MTAPKYTKEECIKILTDLQKEIGDECIITQSLLYERKLNKTVRKYWGNITNMKNELGLPISTHCYFKRYTDDELLNILEDFIKENGFFPTSEYWGTYSCELGLPSCYTYVRHFGSWYSLRELFNFSSPLYIKGGDGEYHNKYLNKDELINCVQQYFDTFHKIPKSRELYEYLGTNISYAINKLFGGYNNLLKEVGFSSSRQKYSNECLEYIFHETAKKLGHTPTIRDFAQDSNLPSPKVYTKRFGSWRSVCEKYGYKPNSKKPTYFLENGERCDLSYECKVSQWLIDSNIEYYRNIPYKDLDKTYTGLMNCDYLIVYNNVKWYVEIAGMLWSKSYIPTSKETILYYKKMQAKEKILKNNNLNYKFIYADEFKRNSVSQLFDFLK